MDLKEGLHFKRYIDLAQVFRAWNKKFRNYMYFSLAKTTYALLGQDIHGGSSHSPVQDATVSMKLFCAFRTDAQKKKAQQKLQTMTFRRKFPRKFSAAARKKNIDGVCMNAFNDKDCFCGQKILK